ncbi:hypothetical protein V8G54_011663 [Vigna mungo]|uniref:Uncharacterized protein n=1 Tax=Vigna mungo TaxID=3915 RepID=A0AAQ3NS17_VIGMU
MRHVQKFGNWSNCHTPMILNTFMVFCQNILSNVGPRCFDGTVAEYLGSVHAFLHDFNELLSPAFTPSQELSNNRSFLCCGPSLCIFPIYKSIILCVQYTLRIQPMSLMSLILIETMPLVWFLVLSFPKMAIPLPFSARSRVHVRKSPLSMPVEC